MEVRVLSFDEQLEALRSDCLLCDSPASPLNQGAFLSHLRARRASEPVQEKTVEMVQVEVRMTPASDKRFEPLKVDWLLGEFGISLPYKGRTPHKNEIINQPGDVPMKPRSR